MNRIKIKEIDESYNREMLDVVKNSPIRANGLSLYFDKWPDIFRISKLNYQDCLHLGFFKHNRLLGFGSMGYYDAWVNGKQEKVFTFYQFCLLPEARGKRMIIRAVTEFINRVAESQACFGIATTLKGNRPAESYLAKKFSKPIPPVRVIDQLVVKTILFSKRIRNKTAYAVRRAEPEDIPAMVQLLKEEYRKRDFGTIFTEEIFSKRLQERNLLIRNYFVATDKAGNILGVALAWDCGSFRRTTVLNYPFRFWITRIAYALMALFFRMAPLPVTGESFRELTITDYAVADRDPEIMKALLCEIYHQHHNRGYHFMNWASCGTDPMLKAAAGFWHKDIVSHIIFTSMDPERMDSNMTLPYIDIAFI